MTQSNLTLKDMTKREQKLFWLLMDVCKQLSNAADTISGVLMCDDVNLLEDILPYDELAEMLGRLKDDEAISGLLIGYWQEQIDQEQFESELAKLPLSEAIVKLLQ